MTTPDATELTREIQQFFASFSSAFCEFDGRLIAQRYAVPYTALNAEGAIQILASPEDISRYFQGFLDRYRREGCRTCRFKDLQVIPLGQTSALASLTWALLDQDQAVVSTWRESYNLTRIDGALRIYASTDHVDQAHAA